jgi:diguanylate cyclase (GGDEF)-like protein
MRKRGEHWRPTLGIVLTLLVACWVVTFTAQTPFDDAQGKPPPASAAPALSAIPDPPATMIRPRLVASYGAIVAAALLCVLYVFRGRAFIVYWIVSWILVGGSLFLISRGYDDVRFGGVMLGLSQLLSVWSAGLLLLAARAFPEAPLKWDLPIKLAAATAVWFLAAPLIAPLRTVLVSGPLMSGLLLAGGAYQYANLFKRLRYAGAALVGGGIALLALSNLGTTAFSIDRINDGEMLNRVLAFNVITNVFVALGMHLLVFEDMTAELRRTNRDLAAANEEVRRLAITDSLTGCFNRRFFDQIERREMQRHRRYGSPISVVFVDVNRFKKLNDTMGHEAGDAILKAIGGMLRRLTRESDYVIRWGGDEFLLLLTCTYAQAEQKAAELKAAFLADPETAGVPGGVGLSIGVAEISRDAVNLVDAIRLADERMYQDKSAGRSPALRQLRG